METQAFSELFPLFQATNPETLDWLLSMTVEQDHSEGEIVLTEDTWGNAVYFIISGWVKVRRWYGEREVTQAVVGRGDFFGETAILDEPPRATDVITLTEVKLLSISAQRFIQTLFKDVQLHHKLLQTMVRRLRQINYRLNLRHQLPAVKLAYALTCLAENYGKPTEEGMEILNISDKDFADLADLNIEETSKVMAKFQTKGWVEIDREERALCVTNLRQLSHLSGGVY